MSRPVDERKPGEGREPAEAPSTETDERPAHTAKEPPPARWFSWWARLRYFVVHQVLHATDSPHRVALGAAIGMWIALLPLVGVQMIVSAALCHPVKGNKAVAMAMAWVSNPITIVPIFLPCYWLGCWLLGLDAIPYDDFVAVFFPPEGTGFLGTIAASWRAMMAIFAPLWLGSLLVATTVAVPTYFASERAITWYRLRRYGTTDMSSLAD